MHTLLATFPRLSECHKSHYFELRLHPLSPSHSPTGTQTWHMQLARDGLDRHAGRVSFGVRVGSRLGLPCPWKMENIVMSADSFYCLDRHTDTHTPRTLASYISYTICSLVMDPPGLLVYLCAVFGDY